MDTGTILYDDHPTTAIFTATTSEGTRNFCILENEDVESLGLTFANVELSKKALFREIPLLRKICRAYKRVLRVEGLEEVSEEETKAESEQKGQQ